MVSKVCIPTRERGNENLMESLALGWKARRVAELALMEDLVPLLNKLAQEHDISGLAAYE